jgi:septum formation protein
MPQIVLASTSKYRKELLERLSIPFITAAPLVNEDEYKNKGLKPIELAQTLAKLKAESLKAEGQCVIGGDQVVALGTEILGKAHTKENAVNQLKKMQGKTHQIITAICIIYQNENHLITDISQMQMRALSEKEISDYVEKDNPIDCAGSYKIEKNGISLFEKIESNDFTAIQGIPLLALNKYLIEKGIIK